MFIKSLSRTGLLWLSAALFLAAILRSAFASIDTIWAEDGRVFLFDAVTNGKVFEIFAPYAGYLHSVPRLIAALTSFLPIGLWAISIQILTAIVATLIGLSVYFSTATLPITNRTRIFLALLTVLAPYLGNEVLGNTANLHTLFLWSAPWVFLATPKTYRHSLLWGIYAFFMATTEIQILYFLPLLFWQFTDKKRLPLLIGTLIGLTMQIIVALGDERLSAFQIPSFTNLRDGFLLQAVLTGWLGVIYVTRKIYEFTGIWFAYLALLPALISTFLLMRNIKSNSFRLFVGYLWITIIAIWVIGFAVNNTMIPEATMAYKIQLRHATVPSMLMLAIIILYLDKNILSNSKIEKLYRDVSAIALLISVIVTFGFGAIGIKANKVSWQDGVANAKVTCSKLTQESLVAVPISPTRPAGWQIEVPCKLLN
jgi:hypothetical protein